MPLSWLSLLGRTFRGLLRLMRSLLAGLETTSRRTVLLELLELRNVGTERNPKQGIIYYKSEFTFSFVFTHLEIETPMAQLPSRPPTLHFQWDSHVNLTPLWVPCSHLQHCRFWFEICQLYCQTAFRDCSCSFNLVDTDVTEMSPKRSAGENYWNTFNSSLNYFIIWPTIRERSTTPDIVPIIINVFHFIITN